jgi:hypothetical protein
MDLAFCYAFDFAMIVVRRIASAKMVSVSFLSLLSYQEIRRAAQGEQHPIISA